MKITCNSPTHKEEKWLEIPILFLLKNGKAKIYQKKTKLITFTNVSKMSTAMKYSIREFWLTLSVAVTMIIYKMRDKGLIESFIVSYKE
jgi:hypothetical protein